MTLIENALQIKGPSEKKSQDNESYIMNKWLRFMN